MSYSSYVPVIIDHTKVYGTSNLTNFVMLFQGTYDGTGGEPDLRTVANGGGVNNVDTSGGVSGALSVPADLAFYADTSASTKYSFEFESYNATTGAISAWVKIPTTDYDDNTTFYLHWGDSTITDSQEDINNVWTAYNGVYHFGETSNGTSGEIKDSKGVNNGTGAGGYPDQVTGKIGNGLDFNSADNEYITFGDPTTYDNVTRLGCELWVNPDSFTNYGMFMRKWSDATNDGFSFSFNATSGELRTDTGNSSNTSYQVAVSSSSGITTSGGWYHCTIIYDGSDDTTYFYVNGSAKSATISPDATVSSLPANNGTLFFGTHATSGGLLLDSQVDEVRMFTSESMGEAWAFTNYASQNDPSTFYSLGDVVSGLITNATVLTVTSSLPAMNLKITEPASVNYYPLLDKVILGKASTLKDPADLTKSTSVIETDLLEL